MQIRPDWKSHAMNIAKAAMLRSEDPYKKVGACILNRTFDTLAAAYNGLAPGKNVPDNFWNDRDQRRPYIIHAEANALSRIKKGEGFILACTLLPCRCCATNIAAYGIKHVVYEEIYDKDNFAFEIFKFYNITCERVK